MESIEFTVIMDGRRSIVRVSRPFGGSGAYQLFIDNYYKGDILKKDGVWIGHLNANSELTTGDIGAIGERIEDEPKSN